MALGLIGGALDALGVKQQFKPHILVINEEDILPFVFTVPPTDYRVSSSQSHQSVKLIDFGEKVLDGTQQCLRISWSGIFLHPRHGWIPPIDAMANSLPPKACEMKVRSMMNNNDKLKLFVPEWLEYVKCKIESFEITHRDHTGDIYYSITFVEEREGLSSTAQVMDKFNNYLDELTDKAIGSVKGMLPAPVQNVISETELLIQEAESLGAVYIEKGKEIITSGPSTVKGAITSGATSVANWAKGTINDSRERPGGIPSDTKSSVV